MFKTFAFAATALTLAAGSAFAAPSDDARTHFQAIASGDTQIVMRAYADQAQLNWVGGPLDGTYATTDAIRLDPNNDRAYGARSAAYAALRQADQAIADANEAIRRNPKD